MNVFNRLGVEEGEEIQHRMLSKAIENAQKKIETNNFGVREQLLKFDQVNNEQRDVVYADRRKVLDGLNMRDVIISYAQDIVDNAVDMTIADDLQPADWDISALNNMLLPVIPLRPTRLTQEEFDHMSKPALKQLLKEQAIKLYEEKEAMFPDPEQLREAERVVLLKVIDNKWMSHIDDMTQLREGIGLVTYGQKDPLVEYKTAGYEMFEDMAASIKEETIRVLYHIQVQQKIEREPAAKITGTNRDDTAVRAPKKREIRKIYPNDPCPCGSGKKFKQCHGRMMKPGEKLDFNLPV